MTTNTTRRAVMNMAWSFKRSEPARAFADCLRGAWKVIKGVVAAKFRRPVIHFGSPVRTPSYGFASGSSGHRRTGVTTSRLGC